MNDILLQTYRTFNRNWFGLYQFSLFREKQNTYQILLSGGLVTALIFCLTILFGKGQAKTKLFWTAFVILTIAVQQWTEPSMIDSSYRIYINHNKSTLTEINNILMRKNGQVIVSADKVVAKDDRLTTNEAAKLQAGRKKLRVYQISKFDKGVYYGLWGFLDVRLGITCLPSQSKSDDQYRHLTGSWYH